MFKEINILYRDKCRDGDREIDTEIRMWIGIDKDRKRNMVRNTDEVRWNNKWVWNRKASLSSLVADIQIMTGPMSLIKRLTVPEEWLLKLSTVLCIHAHINACPFTHIDRHPYVHIERKNDKEILIILGNS